MADNAARTLRSARRLALAHILIGLLLFVLGIVQIREFFKVEALGWFGVGCGSWTCITGFLGISASNKKRTVTCHLILVGNFMGFSITSAVLAGIVIAIYIPTIMWMSTLRSQHRSFNLSLVIFIFGVIDFVIGIWAAILCCSIGTCCGSQADQESSVMYRYQGVQLQVGAQAALTLDPPPLYYGADEQVSVPVVHGTSGSEANQPQFVRLPPEVEVMGAQGTQTQDPLPPYNGADGQVLVEPVEVQHPASERSFKLSAYV